MKLRNTHIFFSVIIVFILASCGNNFVIDKSMAIPHPWKSDQAIAFEFEIKDTLSLHPFHITIRNNTDYKYSNIFFFIKTTFPNGESSRDTVECILANVRGKWLGKGMGSIKESSHLIREDLQFPLSGLYRMEFIQAMRENELEGIEDVGIKIENSTK